MSHVSLLVLNVVITMRNNHAPLDTLENPKHQFCCIAALGKSHSHTLLNYSQHLSSKLLSATMHRRFDNSLGHLTDVEL